MVLVEKVGTGIGRMISEMTGYGLKPPTIEANENWFSIIFKRPDLQKDPFEGRKEPVTGQDKTPQITPQITPQKTLGDGLGDRGVDKGVDGGVETTQKLPEWFWKQYLKILTLREKYWQND